MKIALIQEDIVWQNPEANHLLFETRCNALAGQVDLILLPEMFSTGFSMQASELAETMDGPSIHALARWAKNTGAIISASLIIEEQGLYYNRLIWMRPDGSFSHYDKRHLFGMARENEAYTAGNQKLITEVAGLKCCPQICYDLRFPVWLRNTERYDVLYFLANWPATRIEHWKTLLKARAIENQCYVIGVNRCGSDGNGLVYSGDSMAFDPLGQEIAHISAGPGQAIVDVDPLHIQQVRERLPFLDDQDAFQLMV
jgi:predicted amidohydrolase